MVSMGMASAVRTCDVAVIGGGLAGLNATLRGAQLGLDVLRITARRPVGCCCRSSRVAACPNVQIRRCSVHAILGDDRVRSVRVLGPGDAGAETEHTLAIAAVFIYTGLGPVSELARGLAEIDADGRIAVDAALRTSLPGLFAAGSVRAGSSGQAAEAIADRFIAAASAHRFIEDLSTATTTIEERQATP
jgi:thioredoxin reductase (NADPH)